VLGTPPFPDSAIVLGDSGRSGVVCLEVDEATQRRAVIEAKLNGYRRLLQTNPSWKLLVVVPSRVRVRWLRTVTGGVEETVTARAWITSLAALRSRHLDAPVLPIDAEHTERMLRELLTERRERHAIAPVGSNAWLRILGEGGVEDFDSLLW
jgi:hypothetical protein